MKLKFYYSVPLTFPKTFLSKILQIGENVDFGHCAIGLETYKGEYVFEFVFPKSRKISLAEWLTHYKIIREISWVVPVSLQADVWEYLHKQLNKWYSVTQIITIGLTCIFKPLGYFSKKWIINGAKAQICTELLSRFAVKFMGWKPDRQHDDFGLEDAHNLGNILENNTKWTL